MEAKKSHKSAICRLKTQERGGYIQSESKSLRTKAVGGIKPSPGAEDEMG